MTMKSSRFKRGVILTADDVTIESIEGALKVGATSKELHAYLDSALRTVVTADQVQTLTNKTIDADSNTITNLEVDNFNAGVLNTSTTLDGASDTQIPSALAVKTYIDNQDDAQDTAAEITYDGTTSGLAATNVQAAIDEVDSDLDAEISRATAAEATLQSNIDTEEAARIAADNTLQSNIDAEATARSSADTTLQSNIDDHINDTTDAHDASAISVVPSGNLAATEAQAAFDELQSDVDTINTSLANKVSNTSGSSDNAVPRYDGATGKIIKSSSVTISDANVMSGLAGLTTSGDLNSTGKLVVAGITQEGSTNDGVTTGANATISTPGNGILRLSNASLSSIDMIAGPQMGQHLTIINHTGNTITINNDTGATAANRILTGTKAALELADEASIQLKYDSSEARWMVIGGSGSGGTGDELEYDAGLEPNNPKVRYNAVTSKWEFSNDGTVYKNLEGTSPSDIMFVDGFEDTIGYYDYGGTVELTTVDGEVLNGNQSAKLTHDSAATVEIGRGFLFADKFLGREVTVLVECRGNATAGNVIFKVLNNDDLSELANEQLQFDATTSFRNQVNFTVPESVSSLRYVIEALPEAGSPVTICDDVVFVLTEALSTETALVQEEDSQIVLDGLTGYGSTATTSIRFSSIQNEGYSLRYEDDSVDGGAVYVTEDGIYTASITATVSTSTTDARAAIAVFDPEGNAIVTQDSRNSLNTAATGRSTATSISRKLKAGSYFKFASQAGHSFLTLTASVVKQGSLKQVNVNKNQKIKIPTSEIEFTGANSRGSVATGIVKFNDVAKLRGDAFTIVSTTEDGTYIQMKKAGKVDVAATVYNNTGGLGYIRLTNNQSNLSTSIPSLSEQIGASGGASGSVMHASATEYVKVGDILRVHCTVTPSAEGVNRLRVSFQEQEVQVSVSNTLPQFSESDLVVRAAGNAGETVTANVTDIPFITVEDSGGHWNGSQFTVPEDGVYSFAGYAYSGVPSGTGKVIEMYINGTVDRRVSTTNADSQATQFGIVDKFTAGQVVSFRISGTSTFVNDSRYHYLNITKVGKPNVTGVDVTPFVNIPYPILEEQGVAANEMSLNTLSAVNFSTQKTREYGNTDKLFSLGTDHGRITALEDIEVHYTVSVYDSSSTDFRVNIAHSGAFGSVTVGVARSRNATSFITATAHVKMSAGDQMYLSDTGFGTSAQYFATVYATRYVNPDTVITPIESFSTDTATLTWRSSSEYTLATLPNAPVGTVISFYRATGSTNNRTQCTTRPTQTDDEMSTQGIKITTRAYNVPSAQTAPDVFAIQVGKGFKGFTETLYKDTTKSSTGTLDFYQNGTTLQVAYGAVIHKYNPDTGIYLIDAGQVDTTVTAHQFIYDDLTAITTGYLVLSGGKSPALAGIPTFRPVACSYTSDSGQAIGTAYTLIKFEDKIKDTHGLYNSSSGIATIPDGEDGWYEIAVAALTNSVTLSTGQVFQLALYVDGVAYRYIGREKGNGGNYAHMAEGSRKVYLRAGQTVAIYGISSVATTLNTTDEYNQFSITKVH